MANAKNSPGYSTETFADMMYGNNLTVSIDDVPDVELEIGEEYSLLDLDEAERLGKHLLAIVAKKRTQS